MIALIPAAKGSSGFEKNIYPLKGIPLMYWSFELAKRINVDKVFLTTNSSEWVLRAKDYGIGAILEPSEVTRTPRGDYSYIRNFLQHHSCDYIVLLRPTTPLRSPEIVNKAIETIKQSDATSLRSAHGTKETAFKYFKITNDGYFSGLFPSNTTTEYWNMPRQTFPRTYHPNGYVDIIKTDVVNGSGRLYGTKILPFLTDDPHEIETKKDFREAEWYLGREKNVIYEHFRNLGEV